MTLDDHNKSNNKPGTQKLPDLQDYFNRKTITRNIEEVSSAFVSENQCITLFLTGLRATLCFDQSSTIILGRLNLSNPIDNLFDLTPYYAIDRGVSRVHCQLTIKDKQLYITDLGSTNGTYLNSRRLKPNEPHIVQKRNVISLARLPIKILTQ